MNQKPVTIVTLISRRYHGGLVLELCGEGPKYYRGVPLREDVDAPGEIRRGEETKYEKADYLRIPGKRRDLIRGVTEARLAYDQAAEQYRRDLERAVNEARHDARERFQAAHPCPTLPSVEALVEEAERGR